MSEANKAVFRRLFQQFFNERDLQSVGEFFAPEFIHNKSLRGVDLFQRIVSYYLVAFPDIHYTIEDLLADGDKVIGRVTAHGTHQGEFLGYAATGKTFSVSQIRIARFVDGKIAEHWGCQDTVSLLDQLGLVPYRSWPPGMPDLSAVAART